MATINGTNNNDILNGTSDLDLIYGLDGDDQLFGYAGNDTLDGGNGADTLTGGQGDDNYIVDNVNDVVTELSNEGIDTVTSSIDYTLGNHVENLVLSESTSSGAMARGRYVYIRHNDNVSDYLTLAELQVFNSAGVNIAPGAALTSSDQWNPFDTQANIANLTDGRTSGQYGDTTNGGWFATDNSGAEWIQIDLGSSQDLSSIKLFGRTDGYQNQSQNYTVYVADFDMANQSNPSLQSNAQVRYLTVTDAPSLINVTQMYQNGVLVPSANGGGATFGTGNELDNTITGNSGNNTLDGGLGADTLIGGQGDDTYIVDDANDVVTELANQGTDTVKSSVDYTLSNHVENLILTESGGSSAMASGRYVYIRHNSGVSNYLTLAELQVFNSAGVNIAPTATLMSSGQWNRFDNQANIANLTDGRTSGQYGDTANGGWFATDFNGNEWIQIDLGSTQNLSEIKLFGRTDGYQSQSQNYSVYVADFDMAGQQNEALQTNNQVRYLSVTNAPSQVTVTQMYQNGVLVPPTNGGGSGATLGTGNDLDNTITGNTSNNTLDGDTGADTLIGGQGDDTYMIDNANDAITEQANQGNDTVLSSISHTLENNVENLTLQNLQMQGRYILIRKNELIEDYLSLAEIQVLSANGTNLALHKTVTSSGSLDNSSNFETNIVDGNTGGDLTLGDSVFTSTNLGGDWIQIDLGRVQAFTTIKLFGRTDAFLTLNGDLTVYLSETDLSGLSYADLQSNPDIGYYLINGNSTDQEEFAVYDLSHTGKAANILATGNDLNNVILGNDGDNLIDGGLGADRMEGGTGDDVYKADNVLDTIVENLDEGQDRIELSGDGDFYVSNYVEDLIRTSAGNNRTVANDLDNVIYLNGASTDALYGLGGDDSLFAGSGNDYVDGGAGNDLLDGGTGDDNLLGGSGDDRYFIDSAADSVTENLNEGVDSVESSVSYALTANVENLTLLGTNNLDGTGNSLDNFIQGNEGDNQLLGGAGNDTMTGGMGNDLLDGGTGNDFLRGGLGDDTYIIDSASDIINEVRDQGIDTVKSSISYTLGNNVENLTLTGGSGSGSSVSGRYVYVRHNNNFADYLTLAELQVFNASGVNVARNATLSASDQWNSYDRQANIANLTDGRTNGLYGDTVNGGWFATDYSGNEWIQIDLGSSQQINSVNLFGRTDGWQNQSQNYSVYVSNLNMAGLSNNALRANNQVSYHEVGAAASQVTINQWYQNGNLLTTDTTNGNGNALNNLLTGSSGNNTLSGLAGNDTLDGGLGNDNLDGGIGNDTYLFGRNGGQDLLNDYDTTPGNQDVLSLGSGIAADQVWFQHVNNNLEISIIGSNDKITINNWYLGNDYHVEQIHTQDGKTLLDSQVDNLVNAMAAFTPPAAGQTTLPANYQSALNPVIAANWQ